MCNEAIHAKKNQYSDILCVWSDFAVCERRYKWRQEVAPECQMLPGGGARARITLQSVVNNVLPPKVSC